MTTERYTRSWCRSLESQKNPYQAPPVRTSWRGILFLPFIIFGWLCNPFGKVTR